MDPDKKFLARHKFHILLWIISIVFLASALLGIIYFGIYSGPSMKPTMGTLAIAFIDPLFPFEKLKVGDIVVFYDHDLKKLISHRVNTFEVILYRDNVPLDKAEYLVLTKGDNEETNSRGGEVVLKSEYRGKVLFWVKILP